MNFRLYPILIDLIISHIFDCILLVIQRRFHVFYRFSGAFVHHSHTSYVWLKISTVSESTLVTNTNDFLNLRIFSFTSRIVFLYLLWCSLQQKMMRIFFREVHKVTFWIRQSLFEFLPDLESMHKTSKYVKRRTKKMIKMVQLWLTSSMEENYKNQWTLHA